MWGLIVVDLWTRIGIWTARVFVILSIPLIRRRTGVMLMPTSGTLVRIFLGIVRVATTASITSSTTRATHTTRIWVAIPTAATVRLTTHSIIFIRVIATASSNNIPSGNKQMKRNNLENRHWTTAITCRRCSSRGDCHCSAGSLSCSSRRVLCRICHDWRSSCCC